MKNIMDEAEDTLSLSDFATSFNSTQWADYFSEKSQSSSSVSSSINQELQDEYFEFFSEEWSTTIPENIIFCGKLIPSKKDSQLQNSRSTRSSFVQVSDSTQLKGSSGLSSNKNVVFSRTSLKGRNGTIKNETFSNTRSSSSNKKWHSFLLSTARVLTGGMELKDIETRQSRQSPSASPLIGRNQQQVGDVYRRRSKRLRGLIRALGCGDSQHATCIEESIKSVPRI